MRARAAVLASAIDRVTAQPEATLVALLAVAMYIVGGFLCHWASDWLSFGGVLTGVPPFVVCFAIQSSQRDLAEAQRRDTIAIQAKLDGVILAVAEADNRLVGIEKKAPEFVESIAREVCTDTQ